MTQWMKLTSQSYGAKMDIALDLSSRLYKERLAGRRVEYFTSSNQLFALAAFACHNMPSVEQLSVHILIGTPGDIGSVAEIGREFMITIHCTKKLFSRLPLDKSGQLPDDTGAVFPEGETSALGSWHANVVNLDGHDCVMFVHDATRFPVFIKALSQKDFAALQWHFEDGFMNTLLKLDASQDQLDSAAKHLSALHFDTQCDRSVQGTMNRMVGDVEGMMWHDNLPLEYLSSYKTGAWLAEMLCSIKGQKDYIRPFEEMFTLLNDLADHAPKAIKRPTARGKVVNLDDFR